MSAADHGETDRTIQSLQARVSDCLAQLARVDAEIVNLKGLVAALSGRVAALESAQPSDMPAGVPVDPYCPSEAEMKAIRARLQARTLKGIEANKKDRYRAGRTYQREVRKRLTDVE